MEIRSLDQIKVQIGLALKGLVEHVLIGLMEFQSSKPEWCTVIQKPYNLEFNIRLRKGLLFCQLGHRAILIL